MRYFYLVGCYFYLVAGLLTTLGAQAQVPAWDSPVAALQAKNAYFNPKVLATASNGDVYLAGTLYGRVTLGTDVLTGTNNNDFFVAKWSATTRQFLWGVAGHADGACQLTGLAVNGTSVYLVGFTNDQELTFGSISLAWSTVASYSGFVAKLTDAGVYGAFEWALPITSNRPSGNEVSVRAIVATPTGTYLTGSSCGTTSFGSLVVANPTYPTYRSTTYVAKLVDTGASGRFVWGQLFGTAPSLDSFITATALAVKDSHLYLTGQSSRDITLGNQGYSGHLDTDAFVLRLTDTGSDVALDWAATCPTLNPKAVAVTGTSVVIAGTFTGSVLLGSNQLLNTSPGPSSYPDLFVAKVLDAGTSGSFQWAQQAGGRYAEQLGGLATRGADIFITGTYYNSSDTDPRDYPVFGTTTLPRYGYEDIYLAKLTDSGASGTFAWAKSAGSDHSDYGNALTLGNNGAVYLAANVYGPSTFGRYYTSNDINEQAGILASLLSPTALATTSAAPAAASTLYPNPAHQSVQFMLPALATSPLALTLFNALGEQVGLPVLIPVGSRAATLSLAGLAPGLYVLRPVGDATQPAQRLLVERPSHTATWRQP